MSRFGLGASLLLGLLAAALAAPSMAQLAPRLTGTTILAELDVARQELSTRATSLPHTRLGPTNELLAGIAQGLRKTLGGDAGKPIEIIDAGARSKAYRAHAVTERVKGFLQASEGCPDADMAAMADALAVTVAQLGSASGSAKVLPVIDGVETLDQRPLFVLRPGSDMSFALRGSNLMDAQCEDPIVTATDGKGKRQAVQPVVTGVSPTRIELKLDGKGQLASGSYVLHVVAKHKAFMVGCKAAPEAVAVVHVATPTLATVSYTLNTTCRASDGGSHEMPPITGSIPDFTGETIARQIDTSSCVEPVRYALSATTTFPGGHSSTVGPISQMASAGMTMGLTGGLTLSWDPSVRQLFVRAAPSHCKGVY